MPNLAILIGNSTYQSLEDLDCCASDIDAVRELVEATGRFDTIANGFNKTAAELRYLINEAVEGVNSVSEIFFYFSGHGYAFGDEFYFCATDFNQKRPNESGLSQSDLHTALRSAGPELVVKVVDACQSGTTLIKSDIVPFQDNRKVFNNFIQIASCLNSQNSLTGDPLSIFTEKFISAALKKSDGKVYYSEIIAILRDDFLEDTSQIPFFVTQCTGREVFVEDAKTLNAVRSKREAGHVSVNSTELSAPTPALGALDILKRAEAAFATKNVAQGFIERITEKVKTKALELGFDDLFDTTIARNSEFTEPSVRPFIINVLRKESRPDNFVGVQLKERYRRQSPLDAMSVAIANAMITYGVADIGDRYDLELNCRLDNVQLTITLSPKFVALKQFVLILACAPSLEHCYVFELLTENVLRDFGVFDTSGKELVRRWYKMKWTDSCDSVVSKVLGEVKIVVEKSVASASRALVDDL